MRRADSSAAEAEVVGESHVHMADILVDETALVRSLAVVCAKRQTTTATARFEVTVNKLPPLWPRR